MDGIFAKVTIKKSVINITRALVSIFSAIKRAITVESSSSKNIATETIIMQKPTPEKEKSISEVFSEIPYPNDQLPKYKNPELVEKTFEIMPEIGAIYKENGWEMAMFYLDDATAEFRNMMEIEEKYEFKYYLRIMVFFLPVVIAMGLLVRLIQFFDIDFNIPYNLDEIFYNITFVNAYKNLKTSVA